jgi:hypothetical protein
MAAAAVMVPKAASNPRHHAAQLTSCPFLGSEGTNSAIIQNAPRGLD